MTTYVQRLIAFLVATLAIFFLVFGFAPRLYGWFVRQRFRQLYHRLRVIDSSLRAGLTPSEAETLQAELGYRKSNDDRSDAALRSLFYVAISPRPSAFSSR